MNMNRTDTAPGWVLTKESMLNLEEVVTFTDLEDAQEALEAIKDYYIENSIGFKTGGVTIRNWEDGILTDDGEIYSIQSIEDAVSPQGKVVWVVSHYAIGDGDTEVFNWQKLFATKEDAQMLFEEVTNFYEDQDIPGITFKDEGLGFFVCKDGEPVIKVSGEPMIVGLIEGVNIVDLKSI